MRVKHPLHNGSDPVCHRVTCCSKDLLEQILILWCFTGTLDVTVVPKFSAENWCWVICFGKWILVVEDNEELEGKIKTKGMRSKVIFSWWSTNHYGWPCSSAWIGHEGSWHTGSSTGFQYYLHIQYNYSTQQQYFRRDNFHYSMYSKYY